ncbi:TPA: hypothetical protein QCX59_004518 [Bacillus mycoides]|nr:hypothetical protein DN409_16440 [Bacillus mycoides]HDR7595305.1 hypothetical protein [Bacillus mycoides]
MIGLLCNIADGEFISNEQLREIEQERILFNDLQNELDRERAKNNALQKEITILKTASESKLIDPTALNNSYKEIKNKFENNTVNREKKIIGGIVEFD